MGGVFHGGRIDAAVLEFGGKRGDWIDLSTGINPNPYPLGEISSSAWKCLPGELAEANLINAARRYYQVPEEVSLVAANGTQALIELLPHIGGAGTVSIVAPTYGEHENVWGKFGFPVTHIDGFSFECVNKTDVVVIVNPNNPDCRTHRIESLIELATRVRLMVVDEAFVIANQNSVSFPIFRIMLSY